MTDGRVSFITVDFECALVHGRQLCIPHDFFEQGWKVLDPRANIPRVNEVEGFLRMISVISVSAEMRDISCEVTQGLTFW